MATNDSGTPEVTFDDLDEPAEVDSGSEWINPDAGEQFGGQITDIRLDAQDNGVVEIDGRPYSLNWSQRQQLVNELVVGSLMAVKTSEETDSFTNDDGEEIEYHPKAVRFKRGDAE